MDSSAGAFRNGGLIFEAGLMGGSVAVNTIAAPATDHDLNMFMQDTDQFKEAVEEEEPVLPVEDAVPLLKRRHKDDPSDSTDHDEEFLAAMALSLEGMEEVGGTQAMS